MEQYLIIRFTLAFVLASILSYHGISKKSLDLSGAVSAIIVGFLSFASSYRFGIVLILFYYTSSKLTKFKESKKAIIEENYAKGGQRNYQQVFGSSLLATIVAVVYYCYCGEDHHVDFRQGDITDPIQLFGIMTVTRNVFQSHLWSMYIAHYACATADTWASELGVLSKSKPRLITSLLLREVPPGTNGGVSLIGTLASATGGLFIGLVFWIGSILLNVFAGSGLLSAVEKSNSQAPMVIFGLVCGVLGSLIDSLLGATLQATYYSTERKCIVKHASGLNDGSNKMRDRTVKRICGVDLLSNEAVNLLSIGLTMALALWLAPMIFCAMDSTQC